MYVMYVFTVCWSLAHGSPSGLSEKDRQTVFISLTVISLIGCFLFFLIRKSDPSEPTPSETSEAPLHTESTDDSVSVSG